MTTNTNDPLNTINTNSPIAPVNPVMPETPILEPVAPVLPIGTESNNPMNPVENVSDIPLNTNLPWQNRESNQMEPSSFVPPITQPEVKEQDIFSAPSMDVVQDIPDNKPVNIEQPIVMNPVIEPVKNEIEPVINLGPELPKVGTPIMSESIQEQPIAPVIPTTEVLKPIEQTNQVSSIQMPEQSGSQENPEAENKRRIKNIIFTIVVLIAGVAALLFGIIVASNAA